eukprot:1191710-Prorocentrum_minimum.AAC.3
MHRPREVLTIHRPREVLTMHRPREVLTIRRPREVLTIHRPAREMFICFGHVLAAVVFMCFGHALVAGRGWGDAHKVDPFGAGPGRGGLRHGLRGHA